MAISGAGAGSLNTVFHTVGATISGSTIVTTGAGASVGAVAVLVNAWWTTEELRYGFEDSGAKVVVADRERKS